MKTRFLFLVLAFFTLLNGQSFAQTSSQVFFPSKAGTILTYTNTDVQKSTVQTKVDSVASISGTFNSGSALMVSKVLDGDGSTKGKLDITVKFKQHEVRVDMYSIMLGVMESMKKEMAEDDDSVDISEKIEVKGEMGGIPAKLKKGMKLPDYDLEIKIMFLKMKFRARDRVVSDEEVITTPAGTFKCFVVEENMRMSAMAVLNEKTHTKTWYTLGIGAVRQETYDSKGKLTEVSELVSISIP